MNLTLVSRMEPVDGVVAQVLVDARFLDALSIDKDSFNVTVVRAARVPVRPPQPVRCAAFFCLACSDCVGFAAALEPGRGRA